jgi:hypothetical protein
MRSSTKIAAAVTGALAAVGNGAAFAGTPPTLAQAAGALAAGNALFIAGASTAEPGILSALETDLCGGSANALTVSSSYTNTNFFAVSCTVQASTGLSLAGSVATVFYRDEGGSVVGALPIITGKSINQLNLGDTTNIPGCTGTPNTCIATVTGSSANNGISDSFGGAVTKEPVLLGVTDLEPGVFISDNYPSLYKTSVFGTATATAMVGLNSSAVTLFDQVFGVFVNTSSANFASGVSGASTVNIPKQVITNLLTGTITNWNNAQDTSGNALANSTGVPVAVVDREPGAGSRAAAALYFAQDECNVTVTAATSITDPSKGSSDYFSTGNVLSAANVTTGGITYASIDSFNRTSYPNLALVSIDGIVPSNLAAAEGQYDFWFETNAITAPSGLSANQSALAAYIVGALQAQATAPHAVDVLANPFYNTPSLPISGTAQGSPTTYINAYSRGGVSCSTPANEL